MKIIYLFLLLILAKIILGELRRQRLLRSIREAKRKAEAIRRYREYWSNPPEEDIRRWEREHFTTMTHEEMEAEDLQQCGDRGDDLRNRSSTFQDALYFLPNRWVHLRRKCVDLKYQLLEFCVKKHILGVESTTTGKIIKARMMFERNVTPRLTDGADQLHPFQLKDDRNDG